MRLARKEDIPFLAHVLAKAFYDDPVYQWFFPDEQSRIRKCECLFALFLRNLVPQGAVFTTSRREGVALWIHTEHQPSWIKRWCESLKILSILGANIWCGIVWWHKVELKHPPQIEWELFLIGVDPNHQGKGIGSKLMQPVLHQCTLDQYSIYLDTGNPNNVSFYQHKGFKVIRDCDLPKGATIFQMIFIPTGNKYK